MNCSGKHAAFLLACVVNGWSITDYLEPEHPLQQQIRSTVEEFTGEGDPPPRDGRMRCAARHRQPAWTGEGDRPDRAGRHPREPTAMPPLWSSAIRANAWAIDGPGRTNTVVVDELGLLCKGGAEGVTVMAAPDGRAVAVKILDGSQRATTLVALHLLAQYGAIERSEADRVIELTTDRGARRRSHGGGTQAGRSAHERRAERLDAECIHSGREPTRYRH